MTREQLIELRWLLKGWAVNKGAGTEIGKKAVDIVIEIDKEINEKEE